MRRVVFVGDSITASADWSAWLPGLEAINRGVPGDTTADLAASIPDVVAVRPDLLSILIGTNDFGGLDRPAEQVAADVVSLVQEFRRVLPETRIILQSIMPRDPCWTRAILSVNSVLSTASTGMGVVYLDTWPALADAAGAGLDPAYLLDDGFDVHLNHSGYEAWLRVLEPVILEQVV